LEYKHNKYENFIGDKEQLRCILINSRFKEPFLSVD
uniref:Toxin n=1 Tax=Brugia timori TaxID=42155 RepID=A0A0R3QHD8_9BILA